MADSRNGSGQGRSSSGSGNNRATNGNGRTSQSNNRSNSRSGSRSGSNQGAQNRSSSRNNGNGRSNASANATRNRSQNASNQARGGNQNRSRTTGRNSRSRQTELEEALRREKEREMLKEILFYLVIAVCVFAFLCNFIAFGSFGTWVSNTLFGLFGFLAYIATLLIAIGMIFYRINEGSFVCVRKIIMTTLLLLLIGVMFELGRGELNVETYAPGEIYKVCSQLHKGGGFFSGSIAYFLLHFLDRAGTIFILIIGVLLCLVVLTERSFIDFIWKSFLSFKDSFVDAYVKRQELEQSARIEQERQYRIADQQRNDCIPDASYGEDHEEYGLSVVSEQMDVSVSDSAPQLAGATVFEKMNFSKKTPEELARQKEARLQKQEEKQIRAEEKVMYRREQEQLRREQRKEDRERRLKEKLDRQEMRENDDILKFSPVSSIQDQYRGELSTPVYTENIHEINANNPSLEMQNQNTDYQEDIAYYQNVSSLSNSDYEQAYAGGNDRTVRHENPFAYHEAIQVPKIDIPSQHKVELTNGEDLAYSRLNQYKKPYPYDNEIINDSEEAFVPTWDEGEKPLFADVSEQGVYVDPSNFQQPSQMSAESLDNSTEGFEPAKQEYSQTAFEGNVEDATGVFNENLSEELRDTEESLAEVSLVEESLKEATLQGASAEPVNPIRDASEISSDVKSNDLQRQSMDVADFREESNTQNPQKMPVPAKAVSSSASSNNPVMNKPYKLPPINLLHKGATPSLDSKAEQEEISRKLEQTLASFGVKVTVTDVSRGPSVTRYELQPDVGVKVSKIVSLSDDIKLSLAATDIRIEAPIPGKSAVGIEVPNKENATVALRDLFDTPDFRDFSSKIAFAVGKDIGGRCVVFDIGRMPHVLIAGATGSGKSVCINTLIMSILYKASPEEVRLIMVDPKVVELSVYNDIPHLLLPVVTDPKKASEALKWAVKEMEVRYKAFAEYSVRDLKGFNEKAEKAKAMGEANYPHKMPQIVIIVDELADLMMVCPGEVEESICRLAQLARAAGIHLVVATQRPSVDVITGLIKANMPSRIAFAVSSGVDSRTILDSVGAEKLLGKGDMLFYPQGYPKPARVQGAFVSDAEVSDVVDYLKTQKLGNDPYADMEQNLVNLEAQSASSASAEGSDRDEYFEEAARVIVKSGKASIGYLQRMLKIGFNRAARIMDNLSEEGVVGPDQGTKPREILMTEEQLEIYLSGSK